MAVLTLQHFEVTPPLWELAHEVVEFVVKQVSVGSRGKQALSHKVTRQGLIRERLGQVLLKQTVESHGFSVFCREVYCEIAS